MSYSIIPVANDNRCQRQYVNAGTTDGEAAAVAWAAGEAAWAVAWAARAVAWAAGEVEWAVAWAAGEVA